MGTYRKGILGSFSGKVGTVIGSSWNGIDYMRSLPRPSGKEASDAQLEHRAKFGLVNGFVAPIRALLNVGYKNAAVNQTGVNAATAELMQNGITGIYPALAIDYPNVLISKGSLTGAMNGIASGAAGAVGLAWDDNTGSGNAKASDKAIILVFNETQSQYLYTLDGPLRSAENFSFDMPADFVSDEVHVWLSFISADGRLVSTSTFAGSVTIA